MTERERLIELMRQAEFAYLDFSKMHPYEKSLTDFTVDYLLENGVIVPPCKVGDVVYQICFGKLSGQKIIKKSKVTAIKITGKFTITLDYTDNLCDADIGRWLFVGESAKEEAEQALEGGGKE